MRTPFDPALKVQQRNLDRVRFAIAELMSRAAGLEEREAALLRANETERRSLSASIISFDGYFHQLRSEQAKIARERALAHRELELLRDEARQEFATAQSLQEAADRFRQEHERAIAAAEQAAADDRSAAQVVRLTRAGARQHA